MEATSGRCGREEEEEEEEDEPGGMVGGGGEIKGKVCGLPKEGLVWCLTGRRHLLGVFWSSLV